MDLKLLIAKGLKIMLNPPALRNCSIHSKSKVCPKCDLTNVAMDKYSYVGYQCFILNTKIGSYCSIAERCCIGGESHPMDRVSMSPVFHEGKNILRKNFANFSREESPQTEIGNDVWIGMGSYIKAGVKIGTGAVIGMGSVVTHDVPPYEVWAGVPAKRIKSRFNEDVVDRLMKSRWWELDDEKISELSCYFDNPEKFLEKVENVK